MAINQIGRSSAVAVLAACVSLVMKASALPVDKIDEQAIRSLTENISKHPNYASNYLSRAQLYLQAHRLKEAIADSSRAFVLDSSDETALAVRAKARMESKEYDLAIDDLTKAILRDPDMGEYFYYRGQAYERLGKKKMSEADYEEANKKNYKPGKEPDFFNFVGGVSISITQKWHRPTNNKSKRAIVEFKLTRTGKLVDASIYESSGDPVADQDALDAIRAAAPFYRVPEGAPRVITIRFDFASKALGYVHQVNWIALEAQQQRALLLAQQTGNNQSIADSLQLLGDFKREQGKYEEAAAFYNRALDVLNRAEIGKLKTATVTARLADTCLLQGKTAEAEGLYKQSITMIDQSNEANSPEVREILQSYAKLLYKLSRFDEANEVYARLKR